MKHRSAVYRISSSAWVLGALFTPNLAASQSASGEGPTEPSSGRGFFQTGYMTLDLSPLNASLEDAGLPALESDILTFGGAGYGENGRFLIGGEGHALLGQEEANEDG